MSTTNTLGVTFDNTSGALSVTADNSCGSSGVSTININVGAQPTANFTYNLNGGVLTVVNTCTNASIYDWNFGNGSTSNATSPTTTYATPGSFTITLIASNACGDSDTTTQIVQVLGLDETTHQTIQLFPNPSKGVITLIGLGAYMGENLQVIDLQGRLIKEISIGNPTLQVILENAMQGMYLIRVRNVSVPLMIEK